MGLVARGVALSIVLATSGCKVPGCLDFDHEVQVLEKAQPPSYGARENQVLETIRKGRVQYVDEIYGKDFMAFEVLTPSGAHGYILLDKGVKRCP
jgi:hypothetical protein